MKKIALVGIDNTGKTSIVDHVGREFDVETLHLTQPPRLDTGAMRSFELPSALLVDIGEKCNSSSIAGLGFLMHLPLHWAQVNCYKRYLPPDTTLVTDRDPIIDTLCHADVYLPQNIAEQIRRFLKLILRASFEYPDYIVHLKVNPETSLKRNGTAPVQIHNETQVLAKLISAYEREISEAVDLGSSLIEIDTNQSLPETVLDDVMSALKSVCGL